MRDAPEERLDVRDDIVVDRVHLHRPRLAEHVHQAEIGPGSATTPASSGICAERGDVVDELDPEPRARGGRRRPSRCRSRWAPRREPRARLDTAEFLVGAAPVRPRPGRLPSDIDNRSPLVQQAPNRSHRVVSAEVHPTVGERVGRHVDHPHHRRARKANGERRTTSHVPNSLAPRTAAGAERKNRCQAPGRGPERRVRSGRWRQGLSSGRPARRPSRNRDRPCHSESRARPRATNERCQAPGRAGPSGDRATAVRQHGAHAGRHDTRTGASG